MAPRQSMGTRAKDSDRNDPCQVLDSALAEGQLSMEEHRQRVSSATNAATLGELNALVADLQNANAGVTLPSLKSPRRLPDGWGMRAAVAGVLIVLGIGIGWGVYGNTSSPLSFTSDPGAKPDGITPVVLTPPKQLQSLGGLTGLLQQMKERFGDTMGYRLLIYPEYASFYRADAGEPRRKLDYDYRGGWGDPSTSTVSETDVLVDVAAFDVKKVVGILRGAPETLGIKPTEVKNTYLIVESADDPTAPGALTISIYVSSDFGSGYIELDGAGNVKRVNYPGN